jgi:hypothetical protein
LESLSAFASNHGIALYFDTVCDFVRAKYQNNRRRRVAPYRHHIAVFFAGALDLRREENRFQFDA